MSISDFAEVTPSNDTIQLQEEKVEDDKREAEQPTSSDPSNDNSSGSSVASSQPSVGSVTAGILSKIQPIGTASKLKLMVYGEPGTTKSSFVATGSNNLIIDFEDGLISAKNSPNGIAENVMAYPYSTFEDFVELIKAFHAKAPELDKFTTITIDTFSDLHKRGLAEITEREWQKRPSMNRYVPETEHHQENNEKLLRVMRVLRDLDRHVVITAHSKTVEPKNKPAKTYGDFSESLNNKIMGMMDIVGFMSIKEVEGKQIPVMTTQKSEGVFAKSRIPLPEEVGNPTLDALIKKWEESKK